MIDGVQAMEMTGLREKVKIIIGGAPVSNKFAEDIRADAYAFTAPEGLAKIKSWLVE